MGLLSIFGPSVTSAEDFERSAFTLITRRIADRKPVAEELAGINNLEKIPRTESAKRQKLAAELYLLLERNIAEEQTRNRIPREILREQVLNNCHPERAEGNFALLFLPHYERHIRLFERFAELIFMKARDILERSEYQGLVTLLESDPALQGCIREGAFRWGDLAKHLKDLTPPVARDTTQEILRRVMSMLAGRITASSGELRTEVFFRNCYEEFHSAVEFIEDSPKVLLIVPDNFLQEERVGLMGKAELAEQLRRKNQALETTLAELEGEKVKLSTLTREELEKKVEERTAELVKALRAAEAARKNLEEFSSLATHELRTPIAAVKGYVKLLLDGTAGHLPEKPKQYLEQVRDATERLLALVNAMLNVSRVELGTLAVDPKPTYLPDIADAVLKDLDPKIKEKKLAITTDYDRTLPLLDLDRSLMHAIFENLLSNAVKYTGDKGIIEVIVQKKAPDAVIIVKDNGYGIPQEQQAHIFEKLFRADNVRSKEIEGTGLGLYLVHAILDQAGGTIRFESEEGKGSTFFVSVPLAGMQKKEGMKGLT